MKLLLKIKLLHLVALLHILLTGLSCNNNPKKAQLSDIKPYLDSFYISTTDIHLKQALQKALSLYKNGAINDSMAAQLLNVEIIAIRLNIDNSTINAYPVDRNKLLAFSKILPRLFEKISPEGANIFFANSLHNRGMLLSAVAYADAKQCLLQAHEIKKKIFVEKSSDYAEILFDLEYLNYCWSNRSDEQAFQEVLKAFKIRKSCLKTSDYVHGYELRVLSSEYQKINERAIALSMLEEVTNVWKMLSGEDSAYYALLLCRVAAGYDDLSEFDAALKAFTRSIEITERVLGKENHQYSWCLNGIGEMYFRLGAYEKAIPYFKNVLAINEKLFGTDYYGNPLILNNLATTYQRMGIYSEALPLTQQAIDIVTKLEGKGLAGYSFYSSYLANIFINLGQYEQAYNILQEIRAIQKSKGGRDYFMALKNLSSFYEKTNKYDSALSLLKEACGVISKSHGENHRYYAEAIKNVSQLYLKMGKPDSAIQYCKKAMLIRKNNAGIENAEYAECINNLAAIYQFKGDIYSARILYGQALAIRKKTLGEDHPAYAETVRGMALLAYNTGNYKGAINLFLKASDLTFNYLRRSNSTLSEVEKRTRMDEEAVNFFYLPSLLYKHKTHSPQLLQKVYSNELAIKGMILEDEHEVSNSLQNMGEITKALYQKIKHSKDIIGRQSLLPFSERSPDFENLKNSTNRQEQQLSRLSAAFKDQKAVVTVKDIAAKLRKGDAAIEFIRFEVWDSIWTGRIVYAAMILLPGNTTLRFVPLVEETQLLGLVKQQETDLHHSSKVIVSESDSLYHSVWKPLEKYLKGITNIYYAPAGLLNRVSFQAMQSNGTFLLNKYRLNQLFSTRSLAISKQAIKPFTSTEIWADITYDRGDNATIITKKTQPANVVPKQKNASFDMLTSDSRGVRKSAWRNLPQTRIEMDSINSTFLHSGIKVKCISGSAASEDEFKQLDKTSPEILHMATHGFFLPFPKANSKKNLNIGIADNPFKSQQNSMLRNGLVLAGGNRCWTGERIKQSEEDGILTAYEISEMDLSNTRLVVLSACETALGDLEGNEGVIGLQRAFRMAGVKQMIMSLWKVPDEETKQLMILFYKNLLKKQSPREALRKAQIKMNKHYPPYYWAGFVLIE